MYIKLIYILMKVGISNYHWSINMLNLLITRIASTQFTSDHYLPVKNGLKIPYNKDFIPLIYFFIRGLVDVE